jgi:hypothetical protein
MADTVRSTVLHLLDERRDELLYHVTEALIQGMPFIGVPDEAHDKHERHQQNMELTARRFHQIVQAGASIDWSLVEGEYAWAGRKLQSMGATWTNQQMLIDVYFDQAQRLHAWTDEERAVLDEIENELRTVAEKAYQSHPAVVS